MELLAIIVLVVVAYRVVSGMWKDIPEDSRPTGLRVRFPDKQDKPKR